MGISRELYVTLPSTLGRAHYVCTWCRNE